MREPTWKDATTRRSVEVSVYTRRRGEHGHGCTTRLAGTHDKQDGDGVLAADGDQVRRICVVAGTNDVNECAMVVSEVHHCRTARARRVPVPVTGRASRALRANRSLLAAYACSSDSKRPTKPGSLRRSRTLFPRRVLRSRPPPRSYRSRIFTPPPKRPPARLACPLSRSRPRWHPTS